MASSIVIYGRSRKWHPHAPQWLMITDMFFSAGALGASTNDQGQQGHEGEAEAMIELVPAG